MLRNDYIHYTLGFFTGQFSKRFIARLYELGFFFLFFLKKYIFVVFD